MHFVPCQARIVMRPVRTGDDFTGVTGFAMASIGIGASSSVQDFNFLLIFNELKFSHL